MKRFIFLAGVGIVLAACRHIPSYDPIHARMAWNEDTVVSYRGYYRRSHDTVYLSFKGKERPPMYGFLIIASGGYLSQQFRDHRKIMYLRYRFGFARHGFNETIY